jgi:integrase/recombinase XerD
MMELGGILIDYIPAQLHENKSGWYIDYYVKHPASKKLKRKKLNVNRVEKIRDRRKFGIRLVQTINLKLANGWNPFIEQESSKIYHKLSEAIAAFLHDKRSLRADTMRTYRNLLRLFQAWIDKEKGKDFLIVDITNYVAISYMEYVWNHKVMGNNTYNNYLRFQRTFFYWCIEHKYCKANSFVGISRKKKTAKIRCMEIPVSDRKKISNYCSENSKEFLAMVLLAYHSLIRPKEITYLRKEYFDLKKQAIHLPGKITKNGNDRIASMPKSLVGLMGEILADVNDNEFVFAKNFKAGKTRVNTREINRFWDEIRREQNLKKEIQFYSLRDTGIITKLQDGINPATVMQLADHSSLEVTNNYVKIAQKGANIEAMEKVSEF